MTFQLEKMLICHLACLKSYIDLNLAGFELQNLESNGHFTQSLSYISQTVLKCNNYNILAKKISFSKLPAFEVLEEAEKLTSFLNK